MRILGIDPGSAATGYGAVDLERPAGGRGVDHVAHGVLRADRSLDPPARLASLDERLRAVIAELEPDVCVIERIFVAASPRSALVLGQARGVALAALGASGKPVHEVSAREVKKALVGTGAATKAQVQAMVKRLLALPKVPPADASDALAIAISQAHAGPLAALGMKSGRSRRSTSLRAHLTAKYANKKTAGNRP